MIQSLNIQYRNPSDLDEIPAAIQSHPRDRMLIQAFTGIVDDDYIAALIAQLNRRFPGASILGTTTAGEILEGQVLEHSTVISITCFAHVTLRHSLVTQNDDLIAAGNELATGLSQPGIKAIIVFGCGIRNQRMVYSETILDTLHEHYPDAAIAGGQAADNGKGTRTLVFTSSGMTDGGFVAVSLAGESLVARNAFTLSWVPIGKKLTITRAEGSRVYAIDGRPPFDIYRHYLGQEVVDGLPLSAVDFPLMIERNGTLMAIHATGVHPDGSFDYIHEFEAGEQLRFGYCHTGLISFGADQLYASLNPSNAEAAFIYSCVSRKWTLGADVLVELAPIQNLAPSSGFFCYGEFFGQANRKPLFLSQTLTALCLSETPADASETGAADNSMSNNLESNQFRTMRVLHRLVETSAREIDLMNQELENLARTDSLTALHNRRMFDIEIIREVKRAGRTCSPLSLIMLDVDHFKLYNDTYGHVMGDDCLRKIAHTLRSIVQRHCDLVARYGGEEFMVILPDTNHAMAMSLAEEIRSRIENLSIPHSSSPTLPRVTVSIGVATIICSKKTDPGALVEETDKGLYEAKSGGRNRVAGRSLSDQ